VHLEPTHPTPPSHSVGRHCVQLFKQHFHSLHSQCQQVLDRFLKICHCHQPSPTILKLCSYPLSSSIWSQKNYIIISSSSYCHPYPCSHTCTESHIKNSSGCHPLMYGLPSVSWKRAEFPASPSPLIKITLLDDNMYGQGTSSSINKLLIASSKILENYLSKPDAQKEQ